MDSVKINYEFMSKHHKHHKMPIKEKEEGKYEGDLEKLKKEYEKREHIEEAKEWMINRQKKKMELAKKVKELRYKQSKTGQKIEHLKNIANRTLLITKIVGKKLGAMGSSLAGQNQVQGKKIVKKTKPFNFENQFLGTQHPLKQKKAKSKPFDINDIVRGLPQ